jgi:long-chain acyl-CoA synthetase
VVLGVLPFCHTWGLCVGVHSTLAVGGTLVAVDGFDPGRVFDLAERHRATVLYGSATMFHRLADAGAGQAARLASLRHVKAGAMLSQGGLKERWDALFPRAPLQQGYGLTEASPESHDNPPHRHRAGTVGIPIQDTDCLIADPEDPGRVLPPGETGEVCLRGPQVTRGYWNRPEETAAAIVDGWLRTGDLGVVDGDGYLTIVDRKKDILKFRGYTVVPNVVEECLLRHPAVREAVVVGRRDERDGEVPTAFVTLREDVPEEALLEHARRHLARYEAPRRVIVVEAIPRSGVGKPLRRVLRERLNASDPESS